MSDPFFTTGGTLALAAPSYVERRADRELYEGLLRAEYCYVLTSRQMGKSSLMARTAIKLREQGLRVVLLDLTSLGQNVTVEQWYEGLADGIGEQLELEDEVFEFWTRHIHVPPLRRWISLLKDVVLGEAGVQALRHSGTQEPNTDTAAPVIICIDEIDAVRSLSFSTDEFFAGIRECYNRRSTDAQFRQLTFCLLGVATPSDLIQDVRTTPFNIGKRIELTDFTQAEAAPLGRGLLGEIQRGMAGDRPSERGARQASALLKRILFWTGGHPYLTQRLCQVLAEDGTGETVRDRRLTPATVDALCRETFLSAQGWERDDNLLFVRDRLLRSSVDLMSLLDLLSRVRVGRFAPTQELHPLLDLLRLAGIVRLAEPHHESRLRWLHRSSSRVEIRNRIYLRVFDDAWIRRHMPDAELRRQRAAFRRGVTRASVLSGVVVAVMLGLTLTAIDREGLARRAQNAADGFNRQLRGSLATQRELNTRLEAALSEARTERGHAAAEARNARAAGLREASQRQAAESARGVALVARRVAIERLSRSYVAASTRAVEAGDLLGALPPLVEALRLDQGNPARESLHRTRLATLLRRSPSLADIWFAGTEIRSLELSNDGRLAAAASAGGGVRLFHLGKGRGAQELLHNLGDVADVSFSPDGRRLATATREGVARVWDVRTGRALTPALRGLGGLYHVSWDRSGRRIVAAGNNGAVVWEVSPVRKAREISLPGAGECDAVFSPGGGEVAIISGNHLGWVFDADQGEPKFHLARAFNGTTVQYSPDGSRVLVGGTFGNPISIRGAAILNAADGTPLVYLKMPGMASAARFSPDGDRVVVGDDLGNLRVWDAESGQGLSPLVRHPSQIESVAFSPDGRRVLAAGRSGWVMLHDATTGDPVGAPLRHARSVTAASFSADGRQVLTASRDGAARVWALPQLPAVPSVNTGPPRSNEEVLQLDHLLGGRWAVGRMRLRTQGETVRVWSSRTGVGAAGGNWRHYAVSPDRRWLVLSGASGVQLWDALTGRPANRVLPVDVTQSDLWVNPGGVWLAALERSSTAGRRLRVVNLRTGRPYEFPRGFVHLVDGFHGQGRTLWLVDSGGRVLLWQLGAGSAGPSRIAVLPQNGSYQHIRAAPGRSDVVVTVSERNVYRAWSGDGKSLSAELSPGLAYFWAPDVGVAISADERRVVLLARSNEERRGGSSGMVLDLERDRVYPLLRTGSRPDCYAAAFSPGGERIATIGHDGVIQIWDAETGRPLSTAMQHGTKVHVFTFSSDGRQLVTAAEDGTVQVWDAATGRPVTSLLPHPAPVQFAELSRDGRLLLCLAHDGSVRVWDARTGEPVAQPMDFGRPVDQCRFLPDGDRVLAEAGPLTLVRELHPDPRPFAELERHCLLLAGSQADANGALQPLDSMQFQALFRSKGRAKGLTAAASSPVR